MFNGVLKAEWVDPIELLYVVVYPANMKGTDNCKWLTELCIIALGSAVGYFAQKQLRAHKKLRRRLYEFDPCNTLFPPPHDFVAIGGADDELLSQLPNGHGSLSLELLTKGGLERLRERIQTGRDVNVKVKVGEDHYWRPATTEDLYAMIELGRLEFPYYRHIRERELQAQKELRHSTRTLYKFVSNDYSPPPHDFVALGAADDDYLLDYVPDGYEWLCLELLAEEGLERLRERIQTGREIYVRVKVGKGCYYWRIATTEDLDAMIDLAWQELPKPTCWAATGPAGSRPSSPEKI